MISARTYLDHNATTTLRPEARAATIQALDGLGNPSSVHREGRLARKIIEDAREQVAALAGATPAQVVFTSGASEANNWVAGAGWDTIIVSAIEHVSMLEPVRVAADRTGTVVREIGADQTGVTDVGAIADAILRGENGSCENYPTQLAQGVTQRATHALPSRTLVALQSANNETGAIQPIPEVAAFCADHDVALHTDAVQAAGRMVLAFNDSQLTTMSLSSHKIGGPTGVGALIVRDGVNLPAQIVGGGQERRRRSGTENILGIAGFGAAAEAASEEALCASRLVDLREMLEAGIQEITPEANIIAQDAARLPNTTCFSLSGVMAETLVIKLDLAGLAVSAGSACSSGKVGQSHVLMAMGLGPVTAAQAIRVSLGWNSSKQDIEAFLKTWCDLARGSERAVA